MEKLIADLLVSLTIPADADVAVRPEGVYVEDAFYAIAPNGVAVIDNNRHDEGMVINNPIARAQIIRITTDKDMLLATCKGKIATIINFTIAPKGEKRNTFIADDIRLKIEDDRVIIKTYRGLYRINLVTYNVTKRMDSNWIIQVGDYETHNKILIDELHGILIQAGLK